MNSRVAPLWREIASAEVNAELTPRVHAALARRAAERPLACFFRADDIGVPSRNFSRLLRIFLRHRIPLNLAVVPSWLTAARWSAMRAEIQAAPDLFCWHQHGRRHINHEPSGKKQEFGASRDPRHLRADLTAGRRRLAGIMGDALSPFFTPPWNRCGAITLTLLQALGYQAVSRMRNADPPCPVGLPDLSVDIDLHTRKDPSASEGRQLLLVEIDRALAANRCGFMIHHQRMNPAAFAFLDHLLGLLQSSPQVSFETFTTLMLAKRTSRPD